MPKELPPSERLLALNELMRAAVASLNLPEVVDSIGQAVGKIVEFDRFSIVLHEPGDDFLQTHAYTAGSPGGLMRVPFAGSSGGDAIKSGRSILRRDLFGDTPHENERELAQRTGLGSVMFVPLETRDRVIGVLAISSLTTGKYADADVAAAEEIADHLAIIVEHALLYERSKEVAKLEERGRLAREIHDTIAQSLTGIILQLRSVEETGALDSIVRAGIERTRRLASDALEEARRSVWDLQPLELEGRDLAAALEAELAKARDAGLATSLQVNGELPSSIDERVELALLRITQEALSNARQHARAKNVLVRLTYGSSDAHLEVQDDGAGFDPARSRDVPPAGSGFGLMSMQERARLVGGEVNVLSAPGAGTRVEAWLPYHPRPQSVPAATAPAEAPAERAQAIRLLVVDDQEVVRQGLRHMLAPFHDLTVVGEAEDGEAAIDAIRAHDPDVVLMDLSMPKLSGVDALRRIRDLDLGAKVILLTVHAKDEQIFDGLRAGARGYLLKDVGRDDLVRAIRTVHEGGSLLQPVVAKRLLERLDANAASQLTTRELDVLRLLATGARNKEIASELSLSTNTVKFHIANIYQKLGAQTRTEAVRAAAERGLVDS